MQHQYHSDSVVAEIRHSSREPVLFRMSDIPVIEKLEKFIEDVRYVPVLTFKLFTFSNFYASVIMLTFSTQATLVTLLHVAFLM